MSKKILMILILMLIFGVNNVYADSYTFISNYSNSSRSLNFNSLQPGAYSSKNIDFNTNLLDLTNYSNMTGKITSANLTKYIIYTDTQSINWSATCSSYSNNNENYVGYIIYPDNTQSSIDLSTLDKLCQSWSIGGTDTNTTIQYNFDNKPTLHVILVGEDYNAYQCIVDTNGNFTCPGGRKYRQMQIGLVSNGAVSDYIIIVTNNIIFKVSDTQQIINNNNQNSTTINNSIQDTNNTLKDDNVNGNNSNNTISSIGGTFNTENDFLLGLLTIPYTFWTSITNVFSNSCSALNVGTMFDKPLIFPCIELNDYLGNVFTTIIDVIFAGIIMSAFVRRIIRYYQALLSLDNSATFIGGVKVW